MPLRKESDHRKNSGTHTASDYYATGAGKHVELIAGTITNQAAPSTRHQRILLQLSTDINIYIRKNGWNCEVFPAPFAVKLNDSNVFEPDISVICNPDKIDNKGCNGAPDWVIEIVSPSTASRDYILKLNAYYSAGVREYWIIDPTTDKILVYNFPESGFAFEVYTIGDTVPVNLYGGALELTITT